ncbi:hypothetical protein M9H77_08505 [Catharanthus roseus]|uniref:Uncharacterized protein n=1 Tax=Catharanthus roseus TaxID=4058 RepID=A0ACC0BY24_CATRO|nr:hypothetical protein M9H77_08505 [Catharanthus roseus]
MLGSVTLDLNPVDRGRSIVGSMRDPPARVVQGGLAGIDYRMPEFVRRPRFRFRTLSVEPIVGRIGEWDGKRDPGRGRGKCRDHTSPSHEAEAMPESSSHGRTNAASHEIIGNFMPKMTELLEATLANRRGERAQNTSNDEALERFLRFWPPEFHGRMEQKAKAELFLEQLHDIYDTLQYESARRVTFTAFHLRGAAKVWWFRISKARVLRNQLWTWEDFQEEFKQEYIPR